MRARKKMGPWSYNPKETNSANMYKLESSFSPVETLDEHTVESTPGLLPFDTLREDPAKPCQTPDRNCDVTCVLF